MATIGAPANPSQVKRHLEHDLEAIESRGSAEVLLAGDSNPVALPGEAGGAADRTGEGGGAGYVGGQVGIARRGVVVVDEQGIDIATELYVGMVLDEA